MFLRNLITVCFLNYMKPVMIYTFFAELGVINDKAGDRYHIAHSEV